MVNLQDSKHPDVLKHLYYCVNFSIFPLNVWFHADKTRAVLPTWAAFKNCQGKHFITLFIFDASKLRLGFPGGTSGKESDCQCRKCKRHGFDPWFRKIPWRRAGQPTPVFLPGESRGQKSLVFYSPQGSKESDTTDETEHAGARS